MISLVEFRDKYQRYLEQWRTGYPDGIIPDSTILSCIDEAIDYVRGYIGDSRYLDTPLVKRLIGDVALYFLAELVDDGATEMVRDIMEKANAVLEAIRKGGIRIGTDTAIRLSYYIYQGEDEFKWLYK